MVTGEGDPAGKEAHRSALHCLHEPDASASAALADGSGSCGADPLSLEIVLVNFVLRNPDRLAEEAFAVAARDFAEPARLDGAGLRHLVLVQQMGDVDRQVAQVN